MRERPDRANDQRRTDANGADLNPIFRKAAKELNTREIIVRLRQVLTTDPRIKFVLVDLVNAFHISGKDYFQDPDIWRTLLRVLAALPEETEAAALGICIYINEPMNRAH